MAKRKRATACRIFLSHSTRDLWISERMKEKTEEAGASVWLDAFDLPGGRNVRKRIKDGVRSSTECLILLSPASRDSDWVRHEAALADAFDIPTTFVLLHADESDIPDPLRELKFFNINDFDGYVRHLSGVVRTRKKKVLVMPKSLTTHRVFISHGNKDNELVRDIARRLRLAGLEPDVVPGDVAVGGSLKNAIREGIREADVVLFLLTPESLASDWTMIELGFAEGFDRPVIPVTVGINKRDLPAPLKTYKTVPFDRLDGTIRKLAENSPTASTDL